ncbi:MAG: beta-lactamase family protein [Gemmatimonadetes bacterium]|nr:beta-lactamase family protein [Gemmatimonadota bacterium]
MRSSLLAVAALVAAPLADSALAAQGASRPALVARIDSIMNAAIAGGQVVGASIAVVRGRDTIAVKGYGKANLELGVATPPNAIYEIGSVTKQFTGAAIMQLVEQGKLSLDDDISKWVPQFNTKGRRIAVRRLLDHTSGIRGYTEIPEARALMPFALAKDSILQVIAKWPYDFEPGEEQIYNNSAFFLAGMIVEKASGESYAGYVKKHLFEPAGMTASHYCSDVTITPNKTTGYDWGGSNGPIQKRPLSHVWPYAAGSLCSTARDLVAWNTALHRSRTILGADAYRQLTTPDTLNDGTRVGYAKGLAFTPVVGHRSIHHGGGINGWTSDNLYFPDDSLSIIVLYNVSGAFRAVGDLGGDRRGSARAKGGHVDADRGRGESLCGDIHGARARWAAVADDRGRERRRVGAVPWQQADADPCGEQHLRVGRRPLRLHRQCGDDHGGAPGRWFTEQHAEAQVASSVIPREAPVNPRVEL